MTVSVVVPIYNVERYLERCLCSIFEQTYADLEIILIDDCSTDKSGVIAQDVIERYPLRKAQTQYVRHLVNQGSAQARTTGMKLASGDYIIQIDSDDYVASDYIERLVKPVIESNCEIDVVYTDFVYDLGQGNLVNKDLGHHPDNPHDMMVALLNGTMHASLCTKLLRLNIIKDYGLYPVPNCNMLDDKSVAVKFLYYAKSSYYVSGCFYYYNRINENSITSHRKKQSKYTEYLADLLAFFADKELDESIRIALLHQRIALMGHYLYYDKDLNDSHYVAMLDVNSMKHVVDHPSIPPLYKIVIIAYCMKLNWFVEFVRFFIALKNGKN